MKAPRFSHHDPQTSVLFCKLADHIDHLESLMVLYGNILRVDAVNGYNATAARGNLARPYLTINAALAAASNGDVIMVGPGTFAENVVIPITMTSIAIIGAGAVSTIIQPAAGIAVSYAGTASATPLRTFILKDITVYGTAGAGLSVIGTSTDAGAGALALSNLMYLDGVQMRNSAGGGNALVVTDCNNVVMHNCKTDDLTNEVVFTDLSAVWMRDCVTGKITFNYDYTRAHPPSGGRLLKELWGCRFAGLLVSNNDTVRCDSECQSTAGVGTLLIDDGTAGHNGTFEFHGIADTTMTLEHEVLSNRTPFVCTGATVVGALLVHQRAGGVAAFNATANFQNSTLRSTITVGNRTALDIRQSFFVQANLALEGGATNATCERSIHREAISLANGNTDVTFAVPFTTANYSVTYEITVAASPITPAAQKAATGFRATSTAADAAASFVINHD